MEANSRSASGNLSFTAETDPASMSSPAFRLTWAASNSRASSISSGVDSPAPPTRIRLAAREARPAFSDGSKIEPALKSMAASRSGSSWSSNR